MYWQTVTDNSAVVAVYHTVAIDVAILRHTWLGVVLTSKVRNVSLQCVAIAALVEVVVLVCSIIDVAVHCTH